jgi:hypothetical protein
LNYYNKANSTEIFVNQLVPAHLQYDESNPDHVSLPESNPFFSPLPEGMALEYDQDNIPIGLIPIPNYALNQAKAQKIDIVLDAFLQLATSHGLPYSYEAVKKELDLRGMPSSPTPEQQAVYSDAQLVTSIINTINGFTTVQEVEDFDISALT